MREQECIFCKIVQGELPCTKVYETEHILAFMDIGPVAKGHTLVIPKAHFDPLPALPAFLLRPVLEAVQKIVAAQYRGLQADGVNVSQANGQAAGQIVPHVHFHVIPRKNSDGVQRNWTSGAYDSQEEMAAYAKRIHQALELAAVTQ